MPHLVLLGDSIFDNGSYTEGLPAVIDQVRELLPAGWLPLTLCTVYNGCFPDPDQQLRVTLALTVFNDVILRTAARQKLTVIELRLVCTEPGDYANPIEPSARGGGKIAQVIARSVLHPARPGEAATVLAA